MTKTIAVAAGIAMTMAVGAFALDTRSGHDPGFDFSAVQSYRWVEGTPASFPELQSSIEDIVRAELEARGLSESAGDSGLWVVTHAATDERTPVDAAKAGYGYRWRTWGPTSVNFKTIEAGTLVIDLVDSETRELVWRGVADEALSPKTKKLEKSEKNVLKAAAKLFESFPPRETP